MTGEGTRFCRIFNRQSGHCERSVANELLLMYNGKPIVALKCLILVVEHSSRGHLGLIFNFKTIYVVNRPGPTRPGRNARMSRFLKLHISKSIKAISLKFRTEVDTFLNYSVSNLGASHSNIEDTRIFYMPARAEGSCEHIMVSRCLSVESSDQRTVDHN